jgi:TPR repeat protein
VALRLLERSAESGHAPSQFEVGKMYADVKLAEVVRERGKNSSDAAPPCR